MQRARFIPLDAGLRTQQKLNQRTGFASVLWSSCLAMLAVGTNSTAIMAARLDMRTELSLSSAGVEWAVNAYLVVSAACIVLGGDAADRFGARLASTTPPASRPFSVSPSIIAPVGAEQTELSWPGGPCRASRLRSQCPALWLRSTPARRPSAGQRRSAPGPAS